MKQYEFEAMDDKRRKSSGIYAAKDEDDLALQLSKQGLYLISAKVYSGATPSSFFTLGTGKIKSVELAMFCRQFAIMLAAGMPIVDVLGILINKSFSSYFRKILEIINDDIKSGVTLHDAVMKHKTAFPELFCSMVMVGEQSGNLEMVFLSMADYYEREDGTKRKVRGALAYPAMLFGMTIGIVLIMLLFVVPTFRENLKELEIVPEGITKIVYDISDFLLANWLKMLAIVVGVAMTAVIFGMTKKGKYVYGWISVRIPLLKNIAIDTMSSRFARSFTLLLNSGLETAESLQCARVTILNHEVCARYDKAVTEILHGMSMSAAFAKYNLFPNILIQMIAVGERSGRVAEVLMKSCEFFDTQVERTIASVTGKLQPALLLFLGAVVGLLFIAIYSPMISIMNGINV